MPPPLIGGIKRGNVLAVGNCCYVALCSAAQGASAPTGGGEGRGHIVAGARLQLVVSEMLVQRFNAVLLHVSLSAPDCTDW